MSVSERKRGRPHRVQPQIIAGWRFAKNKSIAETAKKFGVSTDTVKRACRDHWETGLQGRHAWLADEYGKVITQQLQAAHLDDSSARYVSWHGVTLLTLEVHCKKLEKSLRETEAAMTARGIPFVSALPEG